jgi:uncharacterized protein YeaO (DUF488 family)
VIRTARIYDPPSPDDGYRLLVMRFWPRGVRKDAVDAWEKELGPSAELLRAYRAGQIDWEEFASRYRAEVGESRDLGRQAGRPSALDDLSRRARGGTVTLLCGCQDDSRCHRTLLKAIVEEKQQAT